MAQTEYLLKKQQRELALINAGMKFGLQLANDFYQITLNDQEVMGSRVLGRTMLEKITANIAKLDDHFSKAFGSDVEADYLQEELDYRLRKIYGDDLVPFRERHPDVKVYGYNKSRKGWK